MLISARRRNPESDGQLAAQLLQQQPGAILQATRERDRARRAGAMTDGGGSAGGGADSGLSTSPEQLAQQVIGLFGKASPPSVVDEDAATRPPAPVETSRGVRVGPRPVEEMPPVEQPQPRLPPTPTATAPVGATIPTPAATMPQVATPAPVAQQQPAPSSGIRIGARTRPRRVEAQPAAPEVGSVEEAEAELAEAEGRDVKDKNGRWMSAFLAGLAAVGQEAARNPASDWQGVARLAGAAGAGAIGGGVAPSFDERLTKDYDITKGKEKVEGRLKISARKSEDELRRAQAGYMSQKDDIERSKADARAEENRLKELARKRQVVLAQVKLYKGTKLDPSNPVHASLLRDAAEVGLHIDADSLNDAKSNTLTYEEIDPAVPTQKRRVSQNVVTGEEKVLGQSGYVQPVGKDGMTEAQRRSDSDRDAARAATADRFAKTFGLGLDKFKAQLERGMRQDALRAFNVEVAGKLPRVREIEREIRDIKRRVGDGSARAGEMDRVSVLEAEGAKLAEEFEAAKTRALSGAASGGASPAAGGAYVGQRFARSKLEAMRERFGGKSVEEIERIITREGGKVY